MGRIVKSMSFTPTAGIYFTPIFDEAADWASCNCIDDGDRPTVMVAHLNIRNPFMMYGCESHVISVARRDELVAQGYDGVIGMGDGVPFEYVAFDPAQVTIISVDHQPTVKGAVPTI